MTAQGTICPLLQEIIPCIMFSVVTPIREPRLLPVTRTPPPLSPISKNLSLPYGPTWGRLHHSQFLHHFLISILIVSHCASVRIMQISPNSFHPTSMILNLSPTMSHEQNLPTKSSIFPPAWFFWCIITIIWGRGASQSAYHVRRCQV